MHLIFRVISNWIKLLFIIIKLILWQCSQKYVVWISEKIVGTKNLSINNTILSLILSTVLFILLIETCAAIINIF